MMEKMIFGRYIPGESVIHLLDPRTKLLFVFGFIAIVFLANNTLTYSLLVLFVFLLIILSKMNVKFLINGLKPVLILIIFTFFLQLFSTKKGMSSTVSAMLTYTKKGFARRSLFRFASSCSCLSRRCLR